MSQFILNEQLTKDSFFVARLNLCEIRLINSQDFIWFILVPQINNIIHLTDLLPEKQLILFQEINHIAHLLQKIFKPTRLNIAAIGNIVAQMHWHIVVRYDTDKAWPSPVWGCNASPYTNTQKNYIISLLQNALSETPSINL